jgi:hypothetical protein
METRGQTGCSQNHWSVMKCQLVFIESTGLDSNGCNPSDPERACVSATLNFGRIEILLQGTLHD